MHIKEKFYNESELYLPELKAGDSSTFQAAPQAAEMMRLLENIKKEAEILRDMFIAEKELIEMNNTRIYFDARMQAMAHFTFTNLEIYQQYRWKELLYEGDGDDASAQSNQ